jgi:hypothetical protein
MDSRTGELEALKRIVTSLCSGTDDHAAAILARLRLGELPEDVAKTLLIAAPPVVSGQHPRYVSLNVSGRLLQHVSNLVQLTGPEVCGHLWKRNELRVDL